MDFYSLISNATGSRTIGACLGLCGYNSPADFNNFSLETINDIEKYVRNVCCALKREKRTKFIDQIFVDQPKYFTISPVVKHRLLTFVQSTIGLGEMCGLFNSTNLVFKSDAANMLEADSQAVSLLADAKEDPKDDAASSSTAGSDDKSNSQLSDDRSAPPPAKSRKFVLAGSELHEWVADMAKSKFVACDLNVGSDFRLWRTDDPQDGGYMQCQMQSQHAKHTDKINFSFGKNDRLQLGNVMNHLRSHFTLKSAVDQAHEASLKSAGDSPAANRTSSSGARKRKTDDVVALVAKKEQE